ncbi:MAG: sodium/glutamate symporter [Pseudomonadota bacterium]
MDLESDPTLIQIDAFIALTIGIVVFFVGERLTRRFPVLSAYSIPEPVSGGLIAALVALLVVVATGREIAFDLAARDVLLVYFFTTVGLNARVSDLAKGGPILGILLALTIGFMVIQNGVGIVSALLWGLPFQSGVLMGTAALIGGHGTAIAWGPVVEGQYGVAGAAELGIATATVGLILASLLGGPIAKYLIERGKLVADGPGAGGGGTAGLGAEATKTADDPITNVMLLRSVLWIHVSIIIGFIIFEALEEAGVKLPLFVPCLLVGILLSNLVPPLFPRLKWPAHSASMALVAEFSLSVFLSMSLMSMELWTLAASAGVLMTAMVLQSVAAVAFVVLVVFAVMGRNYFAAVLSAGFVGFTLGATPTAIANMTAVTQRYGPSPLAFIVLPLISAFFVDLANAVLIQFFVAL